VTNLVIAATEGAGLAGAQPAPPGSPVDLAWLIPLVPAASAALLLVGGRRIGRAAGLIGVAALAISALLSAWVFAYLLGQPAEDRTFIRPVAAWIETGGLDVAWSLLVDPLSAVMIMLVTWVGLLIHVYSIGYMHGDARYHHYFAYLNLFAASMLVLVLGDSFLVLFVGWELVGLCSYLLIGFWFERADYAGAAKKAFLVNRVGDVGFLIAMFLIFAAFGGLAFTDVLPRAEQVLGVGGAVAVAIGLLLFVGATGKSAQIPLHVWLPDAMAGPTPVSALIHAATMVTAGVYLIARCSPIYELVGGVGMLVAWVGIGTALLAALIACVQADIKRILAYSTVSQLGYMFVGVGIGDYTAGMFHLLTHGFFKALLFLAAGAVMHAMANETDVWRMGGLWRHLPWTAGTALVGTLAIAGLPPLSGFFSKEEILAGAAATPGGQAIWAIGILVAALTAFYMGRWFILVFLGDARWDPDQVHPHEAPSTMAVPLVLLAVGSAVGGLINIDPKTGWLHGWLAPSVVGFEPRVEFLPHAVLLAAAVMAGLAGLAAAARLFLRRGLDPALVGARWPRAYRWASDAFYVDQAYSAAIVRPGWLLGEGLADFDRRGIDGVVNGIARGMVGLAQEGRRLQTGLVRSYALAVLTGTLLVFLYFVGGLVIGGVR
jgi:NADH-quinone oxidoreductase subunit L